MIISEINRNNSTIRIHDDFCETKVENRISQINYLVTESYKRRQMSKQQVVLNSTANKMPLK